MFFSKKRWILPICKFNVKFKFQKWITCRMDFGNFEEKKSCFPNGKSTWKFDHPYISEKWNFFQRLLFIFDVFHPYLTLKSVSKSNFVLHMGIWYKKMTFFIMFFSISPTCSYFFLQKIRQNEVTYCENVVKKTFKKWKNHGIFVTILLHVTQFRVKKHIFSELFTYW